MKKLKRSTLIVGITIYLLVSSKSLLGTDFETWTFIGSQTKFKNLNFYFHTANFFRNGGDYYLSHIQLSLDFPSKKKLSLGIGYKQEYVEFTNRWQAEYRPMLHLYYKKDWGYFSFNDRSRWEFRIIDGALINRYRNQVQFSYRKSKDFLPYVSTEFSFYFNKLDYTRQRTIIGAEIPFRKVKVNLFLGHQLNKELPEVWDTKIMLGTGLVYKF